MTVGHSIPIFNRIVGAAAIAIVLVHLVLALYVIVFPNRSQKSFLLTSYRRFIVLGPYFNASRIKTSHHFLVSYKSRGVWSPPRDNVFKTFGGGSHFLKHSDTYRKDFENYLAWNLSMTKGAEVGEVKIRKTFIELDGYLKDAFKEIPVDSLSLIYIRKEYVPLNHVYRMDTVYSYVYKP